tara:strand:- start:8099 stop:9922 length:1824 start_codon:yes stop_codon:yes gene_type:complete
LSHVKHTPNALVHKRSTLRLLDKYIPENLLCDASERFKARTLLLLVCILLLLSTISMGLVIAIDQSVPLRRLITITLIALQPIAFAIMWHFKNTREASWYTVGMTLITVVFIDHNNASFGGAFTITWILPTSLSVMLLGGVAALKVTLLAILGMSFNFILYKFDMLPEPITAQEKWLNIEFIISVFIILIVTFCLYALHSMTRQREQELFAEIETRKVIVKELEAAKNIAEQAAANKSMFLATMSHELRTPLNSILGNAELLSREQLANKTEARVNDIYSAGQLLISIINDVLDLSKFDSFGIELSHQVYDITDQLKRIHRMMTPKLKPGVSFVLEGVNQPIYINADQNRLSQVILNLVSNAVKFTEQGQIILSLICDSESSMTIQVKDTGVGISEEDAKNLFQDFFQVRKHANRQVEGTGLGLAIIQRIINRMAGTISLDSHEGKGSTFIVVLPVDIVQTDLKALDSVTGDDKNEIEHDLSQLKLLIVDDVAMNCIILNALLEELGINGVVEEHDGEEAVERIRQDNSFDMILMDIRMPKMDGLEASRLIRELAYNKPIIAVTANAFEEDKQACLEAGMSAFLSKPIELDKLKEVLQRMTESSIRG